MQTLTPVEPSASKSALYQQICGQLQELLRNETNFIANAANTASLLFHSLPDVNWVGFYLVEKDQLVLGPFQGKPACVRIDMGQGVCGAAAETQESILVPDVSKFPGHITCDTASQSELVVPLLNWGNLLGVLDVDSPSLNRFDEDDREGIESIAAILLSSGDNGNLPDLNESCAQI